MNRDILIRLTRTFIVLLTIVLIVAGLKFGLPYIRYKIYNIVESRENINVMLNSDYCISRFELNDSTIISVDKDFSDGCVSKLDFDGKHLYIVSDTITIRASYLVTGQYEIKIFDSENPGVLMNSKYAISLTDSGINILGESITIIAIKIKN